MIDLVRKFAWLAVVAVVFVPCSGIAQQAGVTCDEIDERFAIMPAPPDSSSAFRKYQSKLASLPEEASTILLGDSLVEAWPSDLTASLDAGKVVNLGVGRDRIQNTIWFLDYGKGRLEKLRPRSVILLVGTNNVYLDKACGIVQSFRSLLARIQTLWPQARITQILILPRGNQMKGAGRVIEEANSRLMAMEGSIPRFHTVNGSSVACALRSPCANYRDDLLHLTRPGYEELTMLLKTSLGP